ncbi:MAG: LysM peptidoglycan-binding domain-containing protein [Chloroflexi bacterium]|nr:LysM peptidoglycan-binding domain-containing protein [Chloroflexota bacterium]
MDKDVTWLCLRYRRAMEALPADARRPIVITECGIDGGPVGEAQKGWSKFTDAAGYLSNLQWYDNELQKDDYLIGAVIYAMNGWGIDGSFGMGEVGMIRDYIAQGGDPGPVMTKMPGTVPAKPPAPPPQPVKPTQPAPPQPAKPTQPAPTAPTTGASTYTVQPGDTLFAIARKLGVTVQAITAANNITNPSLIKPGQVLTIPKK